MVSTVQVCVGGGGGGVRTKQWRGNVVYNLYKHGLNTAEVHARNTRQKYTPEIHARNTRQMEGRCLCMWGSLIAHVARVSIWVKIGLDCY